MLGKIPFIAVVLLLGSLVYAGPVGVTIDDGYDSSLTLWAYASSSYNDDTGIVGDYASVGKTGNGSVSGTTVGDLGASITASTSIECVQSVCKLSMQCDYQGVGNSTNETGAGMSINWPRHPGISNGIPVLWVGTSGSCPAGTPLEMRISATSYNVDSMQITMGIVDRVKNEWKYDFDDILNQPVTIGVIAGSEVPVYSYITVATDYSPEHIGSLGMELSFEIIPEPCSLAFLSVGALSLLKRKHYSQTGK